MGNIFVLYIGIAGMRSEDVPDYINKVATRVTPASFEGEMLVLPTQALPALEVRVECINPVYITEPELIIQHTEKMKKLHEELNIQLELLKQKNNE